MNEVERLVDDKLADIFAVPMQFGGDLVLEPLVLTLLSLRAEACRGREFAERLLSRYRAHLAKHVGPGNATLVERLDQSQSSSSVVGVLRGFWRAEQALGRPRGHAQARERLFGEDVDVAQPHYRHRGQEVR